jgi:hypothetical protein
MTQPPATLGTRCSLCGQMWPADKSVLVMLPCPKAPKQSWQLHVFEAVKIQARRERGKVRAEMPRERTVHMAAMLRADGAASPLCANRPRALDLSKASVVMYQPNAVTCKKCRERMTPEFLARRMAKPARV